MTNASRESSPLPDASTPVDTSVVQTAIHALATPRQTTELSSFLLHAPLELMARSRLLSQVSPAGRVAACARISDIVAAYEREAALIEHDPEGGPFRDPLRELQGALSEGLPDRADAALRQLLPASSVGELRAALFNDVLPRLGAAAHAPILFAELPRFAARFRDAGNLLRGPLRALSADPSARLTWYRNAQRSTNHPPPTAREAEGELFRRLGATTSSGSHPVRIASWMNAINDSGQANEVLGDLLGSLTVAGCERVLLRTAAMSMLQDALSEAPYGWSHCLTLPAAIFGNVDVAASCEECIAVAATYVLGVRAALSTTRLDQDWVPPSPLRPGQQWLPSGDWLEEGPGESAAKVFHASETDRAAIVASLSTYAAGHEDAHLAKYTLACFDALERDSEAAPLYLAAAAHLASWWRTRPEVRV